MIIINQSGAGADDPYLTELGAALMPEQFAKQMRGAKRRSALRKIACPAKLYEQLAHL